MEYNWLTPGGGHGNPLQYSCLENPHGQERQVGYIPWGHKESETTKRLSTAQHVANWHCWDRFIGQQRDSAMCIHGSILPHTPFPSRLPMSRVPCAISRSLMVIHSKYVCVCVNLSVMSNSLQSHRLQPTRFLCRWDSPGKNTGGGCLSLLQGF